MNFRPFSSITDEELEEILTLLFNPVGINVVSRSSSRILIDIVTQYNDGIYGVSLLTSRVEVYGPFDPCPIRFSDYIIETNVDVTDTFRKYCLSKFLVDDKYVN